MAEIHLETAVTDHTLETGIEVNPNTRTEDLHIHPETVIIVRKDREMTEMGVIREV